jgi:DNA-binding transcriptional LysR family regulator
MDAIRSLVAAGLGFSFANSIPSSGTTFSGGSVVYRPVADAIPQNSIVAATLPGRVPRRVQAAIDLVTATECGASVSAAPSVPSAVMASTPTCPPSPDRHVPPS